MTRPCTSSLSFDYSNFEVERLSFHYLYFEIRYLILLSNLITLSIVQIGDKVQIGHGDIAHPATIREFPGSNKVGVQWDSIGGFRGGLRRLNYRLLGGKVL